MVPGRVAMPFYQFIVPYLLPFFLFSIKLFSFFMAKMIYSFLASSNVCLLRSHFPVFLVSENEVEQAVVLHSLEIEPLSSTEEAIYGIMVKDIRLKVAFV